MSASRPLRLLAALLVGLGSLLAPPTASASCIPPVPGESPLDSADAVFVGTVTGIANNARWATVHVEEVWAGPDQPVEVVVRGGPDGNTATSVDRTYIVGARYVFGVTIVNGELQDNACSGTTPAEAIDLEAMRPADVRPPIGADTGSTEDGGGLDFGGLVAPVVLVAVVGGILLGTVLVARRREA